MSHTVDVVQGCETRDARERMLEDGVAHVPPEIGVRSLWVMGELLTYKVPSSRTGGAYSLFDVSTLPGAGPPPHVQHREDEAFQVLQGEYEFRLEGRTFIAGEGSLVYIPKGVLHAHKNAGTGPGKMLVIQTPGDLFERFFEKVGEPVDTGDGVQPAFDGWPEAENIAKVAAEHGIEIPSIRA